MLAAKMQSSVQLQFPFQSNDWIFATWINISITEDWNGGECCGLHQKI